MLSGPTPNKDQLPGTHSPSHPGLCTLTQLLPSSGTFMYGSGQGFWQYQTPAAPHQEQQRKPPVLPGASPHTCGLCAWGAQPAPANAISTETAVGMH